MLASKNALLRRDITLRAVSRCGKFRITTVTCGNILKEATQRHQLFASNSAGWQGAPSTVGVPLLGQVVSFSNLTASWLRDEERVHTQFFLGDAETARGGTDILTCESMALGESRAFVTHRTNDNDDDDTSHFNGVLKVQRIMYNKMEPVMSATKYQFCEDYDDPAAELAARISLVPHAQFFMRQSDGVPTAVFFFSHISPSAPVCYNGGVMLQAIAPDAVGSQEEDEAGVAIPGLSDPVAFVNNRCKAFERLASHRLEEFAAGGFNGASADVKLLSVMHERASHGLLLHDLIGLATGDWAGAAACCEKARHATPASMQRTDESAAAVSNRLDIAGLASSALAAAEESDNSAAVALEPSTVTRASVDFFCRCKKSQSFQNTLKSMGSFEKAIEFLGGDAEDDKNANGSEEFGYDCAYCAEKFSMTRDEVKKLFV